MLCLCLRVRCVDDDDDSDPLTPIELLQDSSKFLPPLQWTYDMLIDADRDASIFQWATPDNLHSMEITGYTVGQTLALNEIKFYSILDGIVPLILLVVMPFTQLILASVTISDWYGPITSLSNYIYYITGATVFLHVYSYAMAYLMGNGMIRSFAFLYIYFCCCMAYYYGLGYEGYISFDESLGRQYGVTDNNSNELPRMAQAYIASRVLPCSAPLTSVLSFSCVSLLM